MSELCCRVRIKYLGVGSLIETFLKSDRGGGSLLDGGHLESASAVGPPQLKLIHVFSSGTLTLHLLADRMTQNDCWIYQARPISLSAWFLSGSSRSEGCQRTMPGTPNKSRNLTPIYPYKTSAKIALNPKP